MAAQKGLSSNTVLASRDSLKLFIRFSSKQLGKAVNKLIIEDFDPEVVIKFLEHLETARRNSTRTRNARLAALHAFFRYVATQEPLVIARCQQICAIPCKQTHPKTIEYLEDEEMGNILNSVQQNSSQGPRDYALLLFLYNTGARVQEAVDLKIDDVSLATPSQVKLVGKGRKERSCPIWPETVESLQNYLNHRKPSTSEIPHVFLNANGWRITRSGIRYIVRQYTVKAAKACPSLKSKKVSPHTVRHTTAMHLLQSGNEIITVKDWMGHADVNTTHGYVEIDMKMKRKALDACQPPQTTTAKKRPRWLNPDILEWLDAGHNTRAKLCAADGLDVFEESLDGCLAELPQKPALVLEEEPQHLRDGEDDLVMRHVQEELLSNPLTQLLKPLRMTRWAETACATRKHQEPFRSSVRTELITGRLLSESTILLSGSFLRRQCGALTSGSASSILQ